MTKKKNMGTYCGDRRRHAASHEPPCNKRWGGAILLWRAAARHNRTALAHCKEGWRDEETQIIVDRENGTDDYGKKRRSTAGQRITVVFLTEALRRSALPQPLRR